MMRLEVQAFVGVRTIDSAGVPPHFPAHQLLDERSGKPQRLLGLLCHWSPPRQLSVNVAPYHDVKYGAARDRLRQQEAANLQG